MSTDLSKLMASFSFWCQFNTHVMHFFSVYNKICYQVYIISYFVCEKCVSSCKNEKNRLWHLVYIQNKIFFGENYNQFWIFFIKMWKKCNAQMVGVVNKQKKSYFKILCIKYHSKVFAMGLGGHFFFFQKNLYISLNFVHRMNFIIGIY